MNDAAFPYDVFLSHSSKDKAVARPLEERLQKDGLKVWPVPPKRLRVGGFDEWECPVAASRQSAAFSFESQRTPKEKNGGALPSRRYAEKIEEGLEHSRVLACPAVASGRKRTCPAGASARRRMLCMSANAFGSDWALERQTFRFRDPLNPERRFIPLWLDNAPIEGTLVQFLYINWCPQTCDKSKKLPVQFTRVVDSLNS